MKTTASVFLSVLIIVFTCVAAVNLSHWQATSVSQEIAHSADAVTVSEQQSAEPAALQTSTPGPNDFYVSPNGSPNANGRFKNPWDLGSGLNQSRAVKPGNTIWLRGGTYRGTFTSNLNGTATAPIIVRNYPGERAILDRAGSDASAQALLQ